jgi:putative transposase
MGVLRILFLVVRSLLIPRAALAAENLALRQQLAVLRRKVKRPKITRGDRLFWLWLSRLWTGWRSTLAIVEPETVLRWHQEGFRLFWRWKSRRRNAGRPKVDREVRDLVRRLCRENPSCGAPRIQSELILLGYDVADSTVAKYMRRRRKPPSQTWRIFLENHVKDIAAVDFFTVPTATFRVLYCFLILRHDRRRIVHFNVTESPTAAWTAQQVIEAFPYDEAPRYLIRDRDSIYGEPFTRRVKAMGIDEVVIAPQSPWQNPYVQRLIGSVRRCLDHIIVLDEAHLRRILSQYFAHYHEDRTHLALERNAPIPRPIEARNSGRVVAAPRVGGLHHRYSRVA